MECISVTSRPLSHLVLELDKAQELEPPQGEPPRLGFPETLLEGRLRGNASSSSPDAGPTTTTTRATTGARATTTTTIPGPDVRRGGGETAEEAVCLPARRAPTCKSSRGSALVNSTPKRSVRSCSVLFGLGVVRCSVAPLARARH